jgi:uncharacterized protein YjbI with pentapeptide repeats
MMTKLKTYTKADLDEIIRLHGLWLNNDTQGARANLSYSDLRYSNLRSLDLSYSDLRSSDLSSSNLSYSDLRSSNLRYSDLRYSDLRSSNLSYSDLSSSDLRYSDLSYSDLSSSNLRYSDLRSSDLSYSNLDFSCLPLYCGSFDMKVDKRIASQIAYHFCRLVCDDEEVKQAQQAVKGLANQFHRVDECGEIK